MNAQKFEGLLLTLKKRKLNITKEDVWDEKKDNVKNYLVLGHFDEMDIKHIEKWSDWSPRNTDAISLRDEFVDKYVIKVYFPEYSQREKLQQKGFDYGIWNKQDVEEAPFTVVSVINISEKYVEIVQKENKDMKEVLYEQVEHCASSNVFKDIWRDLHCAVCPTIGFSDFVLMFKTPKLKKALEFIDVLKQIICEGTVFLSNVYTMTGFCKNGLDKLQNSDVDGLRFSIRFGLRNGISAATFQKYFEDKIDDYKNQKKLFDGEDETYDVLGGSDSVIVSNLKLKTFLPLYFCDNDVPNIFHPKHEMFTNYIRSMHSEISVNIPKDAPKTEIVSNSSSVEKYKDTYNEYREELKGFVQDQNMPERIVYGIQIVMKRFLELIQSGHCFDVEKIIGDAFLSLEKCTEQNIKDLRNAGSQEDVQQLFDALNCFREIIGNYLADMQRSDSLSLEGRSLSHPSIGSATKLLLFYNGYINTLKEILCGEKGNNFCFVVTSGGTDRTKVIDVFSHLTPTIEDVNSLLIVTMPELSLYTIRESLFHIFHEVLHFCGERKRKDRAKYVIEAVSGYTACWLCDFFKNHQKERYDSSEVTAVFLDKKENCMKKIDEIIDQCSVTLQLNLKNIMESRITKALENRIKSEEENCYYGRYFYQILGQIMIDVFLVKIEKDTLFEEIYELFLQYRLEIARKIAEMLKEYNILYSYVNVFLVWEQEWERKMNKREPEYSDDEVEMIRKLLLIYLNKDILGDEDGIPSEEKLRLDDLLGIVKNIFKECYADCMAKQLLNLPFADFIYSFLADAWNEKISDIRLGHQKKGIWSGRFMKVHPVGHIIDFA